MTIEKAGRITSIDLLRGIIMVIMALDHSRDFLHFDAWKHDPLDFLYTTPLLFLTRWITHYCAPNFIFLAGLSAYLYGQKAGNNLTKFLLTRGLWLILLEFTILRLGWTEEIFSLNFTALVVWAIGISMIFLAVWHKLPYYIIFITGILIVVLHNLTDPYNPDVTTLIGKVWAFLHVKTPLTLGPLHVYVLYPVLPYFGLICLGYCLGKLYTPTVNAEVRQRDLILIGTACIALFVVLRLFNIYGDSSPWVPFNNLWSSKADYLFSFLSFINTTKYPCSLLFILMTVGPALILLAILENANNSIARFFITIGRVPMFYYIIHIYMFNAIAIAFGGRNQLHLTTVYFAWMFVVFLLYFPCLWYSKYKASHPEKWWLSYL
ncbi:MAG: DUF1624 domain-containing protein [Bacteroidia bacterium]